MIPEERGLTIPIKQVMVLGIRMPVGMPLGPRGGVITMAAAEWPEDVTPTVVESVLPPTQKAKEWPKG